MDKIGYVINAVKSFKAIIVMVMVQIALAAVNIIYKLALQDGMNPSIMIAYRLIFATAFMAPIAIVFERQSRPNMTWKVLMQAFCCGLLGASLCQNLYLESLALTPATYASAMANLLPAITFVMAISFGIEKLQSSAATVAKVSGTLIAIGGAMLLTFYKGVEINIWSTHINLMHNPTNVPTQQKHMLLGISLALVAFIAQALWLIIQAKMIEAYPCPFSSTALMSFMGSVQAVIYALCRETSWQQWKLGWNIRLLAVSFSGIVASGACIALITWCVRARGPLFVSSFNPLMLVITALVASFLLDERLNLGSVLGGGLIVMGVYVVLWGKTKEMKVGSSESTRPTENTSKSDEGSSKSSLSVTYGLAHV